MLDTKNGSEIEILPRFSICNPDLVQPLLCKKHTTEDEVRLDEVEHASPHLGLAGVQFPLAPLRTLASAGVPVFSGAPDRLIQSAFVSRDRSCESAVSTVTERSGPTPVRISNPST